MSSLFAQVFESHKDRYIKEWSELLRFPSISAQPEHDSDCCACAEWLRAHLSKMGLESRIQKTDGKPLVIAERRGRKNKPTVLVYGHYDVQPADPLEAWTSPPFEPQIRNGRLYARGAEDNKGQFFYAVKAVEALLSKDLLNCSIKMVFEGEEEADGSTALTAFLKEHADELQADILMVTDVNRVPSGEPTIIMGLRGIIALEVQLKGANYDLHSGLHGGTAPNPATAMARLISSFHNEDGSIAVKGYDKNIRAISEKERQLAATAPFDAELYEKLTGVAPVAGERGLPAFERVGFRPTIEVNGLHSGYGGPGGKTIIPSEASAKISSRIVADQEPAKMLDALRAHIRKHAPAGLKMKICGEQHGGPPLRVDPDLRSIQLAVKALRKVTGQEPVFYYEGASIPVIPALSEATGADPVLVGFGTEDGRAHAPNESFAIEDFKQGFLYACEFISAL